MKIGELKRLARKLLFAEKEGSPLKWKEVAEKVGDE